MPDGRRGALISLTLRSTGRERSVDLAVDVHSELMSAYPWGETTPSQLTVNGQDTAEFAAGRLTFREPGKPWTAVVGSFPPGGGGEAGAGYRGPQEPPVVCPPSGEGQPEPPPRCDDTAYGKGTGGRLAFPGLVVPAGRERRVEIAVAGSERSAAEAQREFRALTQAGLSPSGRRYGPASAWPATRASPCPATGCSSRASRGASRTWPTPCRWPRICRCAR